MVASFVVVVRSGVVLCFWVVGGFSLSEKKFESRVCSRRCFVGCCAFEAHQLNNKTSKILGACVVAALAIQAHVVILLFPIALASVSNSFVSWVPMLVGGLVGDWSSVGLSCARR
jgi:hypothetical protein